MAKNGTMNFVQLNSTDEKKVHGRNSKAHVPYILFAIIPPVQSELTYNIPTAPYFLDVS